MPQTLAVVAVDYSAEVVGWEAVPVLAEVGVAIGHMLQKENLTFPAEACSGGTQPWGALPVALVRGDLALDRLRVVLGVGLVLPDR